jgi:hypothetical protein
MRDYSVKRAIGEDQSDRRDAPDDLDLARQDRCDIASLLDTAGFTASLSLEWLIDRLETLRRTG